MGKTRIAKRGRTECRVPLIAYGARCTPSLCNSRLAYKFPIIVLPPVAPLLLPLLADDKVPLDFALRPEIARSILV